MKTYLDYINDNDIVNEPMALREVHAIRLLLNDKTKNMTPEQRSEHTRNSVLYAEKQLGIKFRRPNDTSVAGTLQ